MQRESSYYNRCLHVVNIRDPVLADSNVLLHFFYVLILQFKFATGTKKSKALNTAVVSYNGKNNAYNSLKPLFPFLLFFVCLFFAEVSSDLISICWKPPLGGDKSIAIQNKMSQTIPEHWKSVSLQNKVAQMHRKNKMSETHHRGHTFIV